MNIFKKIENCNILFVVGAHDKTYIELNETNNCELFVTNKGHSIPNLNKKNDYISIVAINKIHQFIEKT